MTSRGQQADQHCLVPNRHVDGGQHLSLGDRAAEFVIDGTLVNRIGPEEAVVIAWRWEAAGWRML